MIITTIIMLLHLKSNFLKYYLKIINIKINIPPDRQDILIYYNICEYHFFPTLYFQEIKSLAYSDNQFIERMLMILEFLEFRSKCAYRNAARFICIFSSQQLRLILISICFHFRYVQTAFIVFLMPRSIRHERIPR